MLKVFRSLDEQFVMILKFLVVVVLITVAFIVFPEQWIRLCCTFLAFITAFAYAYYSGDEEDVDLYSDL